MTREQAIFVGGVAVGVAAVGAVTLVASGCLRGVLVGTTATTINLRGGVQVVVPHATIRHAAALAREAAEDAALDELIEHLLSA
jgi:hypothetical protein